MIAVADYFYTVIEFLLAYKKELFGFLKDFLAIEDRQFQRKIKTV